MGGELLIPERAGRARSLRSLARSCSWGPCLALVLAAGGCALPRWPVESVVTSPFGVRWEGILPSIHRGVDLQASEGTPIYAMAAGRVRYTGWMNGYGNVVWLDHPGGVISLYAHLSRIDVETGGTIEREALIGLSGSTGSVSGPHLHFEVWKGDRQVDPVRYLGGPP